MKPVKVPIEALFSEASTPLIATPKIDGIRCMLIDGVATSASGKPLPNRYLQQQLAAFPDLNYCDGELVLPGASFSETASAVMSSDGEPDLMWKVFDWIDPDYTYRERLEIVKRMMLYTTGRFVEAVPYMLIDNEHAAIEFLASAQAAGYEGAVFRHPYSLYKHGRSTLKERGMMAVKPFIDAEATVIGMEPLYTNQNPQERNEFGLAKRSSAQQGQLPLETLGALVVTMDTTTFKIGTGFTATERQHIWANPKKYIGAICTFKYMQHGVLNTPRHPVFLHWRDAIDTTT